MSDSSRSGRIIVCAVLAAVVFFGRAWLIRSNGSTVPFWDQWDAEALGLYRPWINGDFHWSLLWQPHNEHRIFFTRLIDLLLLSACGKWNLWAQLLLNAVLHTGIATLLAGWFWPGLSRRQQVGLVVVLAMLFLAPAGWQNALWGFESQIYFTILLSLLAIFLLGAHETGSWRRWMGSGCAVAALFTTGGGVLAAAAVAGVILATGGSSQNSGSRWQRVLPVIVILSLGIWLSVTVPAHAALGAKTFKQFTAVFTRCLAWPWVDIGVLAAPLQLPLLFLLWWRRRGRVPLDVRERGALGIVLFTWLQAAAVAYGRGQGLLDARPLSRYQDLLIPGVVAQVFAILRLARLGSPTLRIAGVIWTAVMLAGLIQLTERNFTLNLPYKRAQDRAGLAAIQAYAFTHDEKVLTQNQDFPPPHPDPRVIQRVIDDPLLRPILPPELLSGNASSTTPQPAVIRFAPVLLAISSLGLVALLWWRWRIPDRPPISTTPLDSL